MNEPYAKKQVRYIGFHARMTASVVDIALTALVIMPFVQKLIPGSNAMAVAVKPVIEDIAQQQPASIMAFWHSFIKDPRVYDYFIAQHGLLHMILLQLLQIAIMGVFFIACWCLFDATPGKWLLKMRIADETTMEKPSFKQYIQRFIGYQVAGAPLMLGFFAIGWDKHKQGWHDKMAKTVVISR